MIPLRLKNKRAKVSQRVSSMNIFHSFIPLTECVGVCNGSFGCHGVHNITRCFRQERSTKVLPSKPKT